MAETDSRIADRQPKADVPFGVLFGFDENRNLPLLGEQ
jgi:hypothetical protein